MILTEGNLSDGEEQLLSLLLRHFCFYPVLTFSLSGQAQTLRAQVQHLLAVTLLTCHHLSLGLFLIL
jgi:hypothetical protein